MLQKSTITIPLGLGVNTKTDEKLVEQGQFNLVAENAVFPKVGAVKKRQAFDNFSNVYYNPDSASGSSGTISGLTYTPLMAAALGSSLFLRTGNGEYLYSHKDSFIYRPSNPIPECRVTSVPIYSAKYTVDHADCDYDPYENIAVAAVKDSSATTNGQAKLIIHDRNTGSTVYSTVGGSFGGGANSFGYVRASFTRVAGVSYYNLIYVDSTRTLYIYTFNKYGQQVGSSFSQANIPSYGSAASGNGPIAICRNTASDVFYLVLPTTTSATGRFISFSGSSVVVNTTFSLATAATGFITSTARYTAGGIRFAYTIFEDVQEMVLSTSGAITTAEATKFTTTSIVSLAYSRYSNDIFYTEGVTGLIYSAKHGRWDGSSKIIDNYNCGSVTDAVSTSYGLNLQVLSPIISSGATVGRSVLTGYYACPTGQASGTKVFARTLVDQGMNPLGRQVSRLGEIGNGEVVAALPYYVVDGTDDSKFNLNLTFYSVAHDHKSSSRVLMGKNLHIQGGFLVEFDGEKLFENGFHLQCPPPTLTQTGTGLTGTYSYCLVQKFVDKNGQITRSAPSNSVSTGAITNKSIQVTMKSVPFGVKSSSCSIEVYRTQSLGTTFYYVGEVLADTMTSSNSAWSSSFVDGLADNQIADNPILYTTGNVLPNDPAPACKSIAQGGNRIILGGLEDEDEIAYSKKKLFGESVNFSDFFRMRVDTSQYNIAGGVIAVGYMDDKIIILKRNSLFYVSGDGPNETGANDTFITPELISSEAGCTDPRSVVLTPNGLMFKGDKGIYLLSRGLETLYLGAAVESYNDYNCVAAVHVEKKNLVNFALKSDSDGVIASYDYYTDQWSVIPGRSMVDADVIDSDMVILENDLPMIQNGADFTDNSSVYSMKVKTPWIKVAGLQDFSRIWSCTILGKYKSAHTLSVKVKYDFDESYSEDYSIAPQPTDSQYEYRVHLKKQKCSAIQFEIYDSAQTGESMELTALTLEVGLKKGSAKLPAARKY